MTNPIQPSAARAPRRSARLLPWLALALAACSSTPGESMLARFNTVPNGATVLVERLNLQMSTPCDLDFNLVETDDVLVVRKAGFRTVRCTLAEVPQVAVGSYELTLEKQ